MEPLGTNPLINIYRKFTPNARSPDEHPFKSEDIKLINSIFKNVEIKYYGFLTLYTAYDYLAKGIVTAMDDDTKD